MIDTPRRPQPVMVGLDPTIHATPAQQRFTAGARRPHRPQRHRGDGRIKSGRDVVAAGPPR